MKKYLPVIGFAAVAYGLIYWLRKKAAAGSNLRYEPVDVAIDIQKIKQSLFTRIYYKVKLNLINDESVSVNIKSINLNVFVGDRPFGSIVKNDSFSVPAKSNQIISLDTSFSSLSAIALIKDIILEGLQDPIIVNGYIQTDLGRVNIEFRKNPSGGIGCSNEHILNNIQGSC
jgi:translation elongation factor EF-1beta